MAKKSAMEAVEKPSRANVPNVINLPEGDNNKYTTFALAIASLPAIDVRDPVQLKQRMLDYFKLCADHDMKPAVAAMALAFGMDRRRLWEINTDQPKQGNVLPLECREIIKTAYNSLEVLWESWTVSGKINPVSAIFLGKNNFGYRDQQEHIVTPNTSQLSVDPATIEAKYAELPDMGGDD